MTPPSPETRELAAEVQRRLVGLHGAHERVPRRAPMHELISTMLSHRTTEADEARAYRRLRERFPSWDEVRSAPLDELIDALSPARFPGSKAPNIQRTLAAIHEARGAYEIDFLADLPAEEGLVWLLALPGVGVKTASLVLLFCFGKPLLPVDTHVHRVSTRVGLIAPGTTAERAHRELLALLPADADALYSFHVSLLRHGQRVCRWSRPQCRRCPLRELCDWYRDHRAEEGG